MIQLIKSSFYHEDETKKKLIDFIIQSPILSMNKQCAQFEHSFAVKQERNYAVYVNSGSMANLVLIQSLLNLGRLKPGDRIGVSSLTWATNIMPIIQLGLVPILVDCETETLNVSPRTLGAVIDSIDALFITNVLGFSDNLPEIKKMCDHAGVILIEDNCESLGSKIGGTLLGNFGLASTFSFFVGHHLSTIEGGMVCTSDEELHDMLVMSRAHGWDRNLPPEKQANLRSASNVNDFYAKYLFYDLAYNARPTEIGGFLGNIQINFWDEIVSKREQNYDQFTEAVKQNPDLIPVENNSMEITSSFALPIICKDTDKCAKYKQAFMDIAETRPIIAGDMSEQPFFRKYVRTSSTCPNARFVHECGFYVGNNPELLKEEIDSIKTILKQDA